MSKDSLQVNKELKKLANPEKAAFFLGYFKTGKGEYGEGERFLGVTMPDQRKIAKQYRQTDLAEVLELLQGEYHEHRMTGLLILTYQFEKADERQRKAIYDFYYKHRKYVNNWDLVDTSAHKIMGVYLRDKDRSVLHELSRSRDLWEKRIAMIATFYFIKEGDFKDALKIAETLVHDEHDLIHKAVGWMLREIGKKDPEAEKKFLRKHHKTMPRTMWRYAVENGVTI
ncbi:MAG: DNA alkylation repair protein [Candidatus Peregrinibacteria bacterium]|nr:DNA alkylation repair protein [Candidatus Peregrinibacteria bacterium]